MFKTKKSFYTMIAVTFLVVTVLASCSPSKPAPQFKLRIGLFPVQDYLPYFVMQEQGFAKQNGLQFEETSYKNSAPFIEAMVVGLLDMGAVGNLGFTSAAVGDVVPGKGGYEP